MCILYCKELNFVISKVNAVVYAKKDLSAYAIEIFIKIAMVIAVAITIMIVIAMLQRFRL